MSTSPSSGLSFLQSFMVLEEVIGSVVKGTAIAQLRLNSEGGNFSHGLHSTYKISFSGLFHLSGRARGRGFGDGVDVDEVDEERRRRRRIKKMEEEEKELGNDERTKKRHDDESQMRDAAQSDGRRNSGGSGRGERG